MDLEHDLTNAPVMMAAEKLSDAILGQPPLPPIDAPFNGPSCSRDNT